MSLQIQKEFFTDVNGPIDLIVNIYLDVDVVKDYILLNYIEIQ